MDEEQEGLSKMHVTFEYRNWVVRIGCPETGEAGTFDLGYSGRHELLFTCEHGDSTIEIEALSIAGGKRGVKRLRTEFPS